MKLVALALALFALGACSKPAGAGPSGEPSAVCTKEGAQCTYAEGKIGLCSATVTAGAQATCDGGPCLTCMSLH